MRRLSANFGKVLLLSPANGIIKIWMEDTLKKVIHQYLSKEETEVLLQYYQDGKSISDIASAWSVTPNSVYSYFSKILRKLRHPRSSRQLKQFIVQRDNR